MEGSWEFAHPVYKCFVDLEKAYNFVPQGVLWEVLYMMPGSMLRGIRFLHTVRVMSVFFTRSQIRFLFALASTRVIPCHNAVCDFHGQGLKVHLGRG